MNKISVGKKIIAYKVRHSGKYRIITVYKVGEEKKNCNQPKSFKVPGPENVLAQENGKIKSVMVK